MQCSQEEFASLGATVQRNFESRQVAFLRAFVDQPSCSRELANVEAAMLMLETLAQECDLRVQRVPDPTNEHATHRVFTSSATAPDTRSIALVGHADTVFPHDFGFLRFERDGDVARGPGVLDMKSGISSCFFAWRALHETFPEAAQRLPLRIIIVSDEEIGSRSSRVLYQQLAPKLSAALVFEAGREADRIVTRRRGGGLYEIAVHGRAAHAGNAHAEGVNAIHAASYLIPKLEALTQYERGVLLNVGLIHGGTAKNTVPELVTLGVDVRYEAAADATNLDRAVQDLVANPFADVAVPEKLRNARFVLTGGMTRPPMQPSDITHKLLMHYGEHARAAQLGADEAPLQGGGSDGNLLAAFGVPTIDGLGPYGKHFHETSEWCSLSSLERRTQALAAFLLSESRAAF